MDEIYGQRQRLLEEISQNTCPWKPLLCWSFKPNLHFFLTLCKRYSQVMHRVSNEIQGAPHTFWGLLPSPDYSLGLSQNHKTLQTSQTTTLHMTVLLIDPKSLYFPSLPHLFFYLNWCWNRTFQREEINIAFGHIIYFSSVFIHLNLDILYVKLRDKPKLCSLGCLSNTLERK